jgi:cytochrome c peroxidase
MALEAFQQTPAEFFPYSSRYDTLLCGQGNLNRQELRGLAAFNDPAKGNCASCHTSRASSAGHPRFTDFGYIALGVPRNPNLAANANPGYQDMGLCGSQRTDLAGKPEYCGLFRTPSPRNVAIRKSFFHHGAFHSLEEALRFYAERDSHPEKWYPRSPNGTALKFNDLPQQYHGNIYRDAPFAGALGNYDLSPEDIRDSSLSLGR